MTLPLTKRTSGIDMVLSACSFTKPIEILLRIATVSEYAALIGPMTANGAGFTRMSCAAEP